MNQLNKNQYAAGRHHNKLNYRVITLIAGALCLSATSAWSSNSSKIPTHSTTIDLTENEKKLVSVNRDSNSISVFKVTHYWDNQALKKITEIGVGSEPSCVAIHKNKMAFITNSASGHSIRCEFETIQGYGHNPSRYRTPWLCLNTQWSHALCREFTLKAAYR